MTSGPHSWTDATSAVRVAVKDETGFVAPRWVLNVATGEPYAQ